jgi:hypothetical protein
MYGIKGMFYTDYFGEVVHVEDLKAAYDQAKQYASYQGKITMTKGNISIPATTYWKDTLQKLELISDEKSNTAPAATTDQRQEGQAAT